MNKSRSGFTIVELLIVIIVIGILAAITITAYHGVQVKARAAQTTAAANTYDDALGRYKAINGHYPISTELVCLGGPYVTSTVLANGSCYLSDETTVSTLPAMSAAIATVLSTMPIIDNEINVTGLSTRGVLYDSDTSGDVGIIRYYLKGNHECPRGISNSFSIDETDITSCQIILR